MFRKFTVIAAAITALAVGANPAQAAQPFPSECLTAAVQPAVYDALDAGRSAYRSGQSAPATAKGSCETRAMTYGWYFERAWMTPGLELRKGKSVRVYAHNQGVRARQLVERMKADVS